MDPPKRVAPVKQNSAPVRDPLSGTPDHSPDPKEMTWRSATPSTIRDGRNTEIDCMSLNSAERFAMRVLADLGDTITNSSDPEDVPLNEQASTGSLHNISGPASPPAVSPEDNCAETSSNSGSSSKLAVREAPTIKKKGRKGYWIESEPLPPAVSPATRQQKWLWREVGMLGPLSWVQEVQIQVANLACALSEDSNASDGDAEEMCADVGAQPWSSKFVTRDLFMDIVRWRRQEGSEGYDRWDGRARREFTEATLLQRAQYLSARMTTHQSRGITAAAFIEDDYTVTKYSKGQLVNWYRYQSRKISRTDATVPRAANANAGWRAMFCCRRHARKFGEREKGMYAEIQNPDRESREIGASDIKNNGRAIRQKRLGGMWPRRWLVLGSGTETSWATPEETELLHTMLADFLRRQADGKLHLFWPIMEMKYFSLFPVEGRLGLPLPNDPSARTLTDDEVVVLGAVILAKKKACFVLLAYEAQILTVWNSNSLTGVGVGRAKEKDAEGNEESDVEGHGEKVAEGDEEKGDEEKGANKPETLKGKHMAMRTRVVAELWVEASKEDQASVAAEIAKEKEELRLEALAEEKPEGEHCASTPGEFQDGINALETVYADVHKATYNASGWVRMTIMGGPNPRLNGELSMKIICFGETLAGNDACVDFEPSGGFLRHVFSAAERQASTVAGDKVEAEESLIPPTPTGLYSFDSPTVPVFDGEEGVDMLGSHESSGNPSFNFRLFDESSFEEPPSSPVGSSFEKTMSRPPWPPGMSAPLSPRAALALARIERGVPDGGATMAINPLLENLTAVGSLSPTSRSASPWSKAPAYPPSTLFQAFTPERMRGEASRPGSATLVWQKTGSSQQGATTWAARGMANLITASAVPSSRTSPPLPMTMALPTAAFNTGVTPTAAARAPLVLPQSHTTGVPPKTMPTPAPAARAPPPVFPQPPPKVMPTPAAGARAAPLVFPQSRIASVPPKVAATPAFRQPGTPPISISTRSTAVTGDPLASEEGTPAPAVMPGSRPATKLPVAKAAKAVPKGRSGPAAAKKESAAKQAKKAAVKKAAARRGTGSEEDAPPVEKNRRGRPPKNAVEAEPLADTTNTEPRFTITNNNRRGAQRVAAAEEEEKREQAHGWIQTTQEGHDCLTLLNSRAPRERRPTTFHDGTVAQRLVKGRWDPNTALEEALVARTRDGKGKDVAGANAKKRKASETSAPKSKREIKGKRNQLGKATDITGEEGSRSGCWAQWGMRCSPRLAEGGNGAHKVRNQRGMRLGLRRTQDGRQASPRGGPQPDPGGGNAQVNYGSKGPVKRPENGGGVGLMGWKGSPKRESNWAKRLPFKQEVGRWSNASISEGPSSRTELGGPPAAGGSEREEGGGMVV
ncbi:hypothetical protein DFH07DRAFT_768997 [Mycena maculata]|uniref:Uncharacterized protein n=1 Tax=Mycena maculata TaxID=230809 RepID=A0AAD7JPL2_9AGAR|nr:hypothetical protein DFH07DRAFT_768997 [Mycena maculata]